MHRLAGKTAGSFPRSGPKRNTVKKEGHREKRILRLPEIEVKKEKTGEKEFKIKIRAKKFARLVFIDTQIETPESGAEFAVYLKSAGSYEVAEDTERDYLTCDENGFAQTKDMPYGIYTVHQVSSWEGSELCKKRSWRICRVAHFDTNVPVCRILRP